MKNILKVNLIFTSVLFLQSLNIFSAEKQIELNNQFKQQVLECNFGNAFNLIKKGADPNILINGQTFLHVLIYRCYFSGKDISFLNKLLSYSNVDVYRRNSEGVSPLLYAEILADRFGQVNTQVTALLDKRVSISILSNFETEKKNYEKMQAKKEQEAAQILMADSSKKDLTSRRNNLILMQEIHKLLNVLPSYDL